MDIMKLSTKDSELIFTFALFPCCFPFFFFFVKSEKCEKLKEC